MDNDVHQEARQASLEELLDELDTHRGEHHGERHQSYQRVLPEARKLEHVPLVHGTDRVSDLMGVAKAQALLSRAARGKTTNRREAYLGIADVVYTSAGILYPDARAAFVISPDAEGADSQASPWDSGALCRALRPDLPPLPDPARRDLLWRYTLPAPQYRSYLVHYVASCYRVWDHYLEVQCPLAFPDPAGVISAHERSRSFEVRVRQRIPVQAPYLLAVFLLYNGVPMDRTITKWLQASEQAGVVVKTYSGSSRGLTEEVRGWIRQYLEHMQ